jgi:tetratricopeptide (TPR) repeat protein
MRRTSILGELDPLGMPSQFTPRESFEIARSRHEWEQEGGVTLAVEVASTALAVRQPELGVDAARFVLENRQHASQAALLIASRVLHGSEATDESAPAPGDGDVASANEAIRILRRRLERGPRNAVAWTDLAHAHAVVGHREKAGRAMTAAIGLAPANRFVLRAAARFHVWNEDPEQGHYILAHASSVADDPWLMAAEIAVAEEAGRKPVLARAGRKLLESGRFAPRHVAELAGALATLELEDGKARKARQLFERALVAPNENVLAQAEWATSRLPGLELNSGELRAPQAFEARARSDATEGRWSEALDETWRWHRDEGFAIDPALFGSAAASSGLVDFDAAEKFAEAGLVGNPGEPRLLNNLAYSLLELGRIDEAVARLREIDIGELDGRARLIVAATNGLLAYKLGDVGRGRELYRQVIAIARNEGRHAIAAMAALLQARQEILTNGEEARMALASALEISRNEESPAVRAWRQRLETYSLDGGVLL